MHGFLDRRVTAADGTTLAFRYREGSRRGALPMLAIPGLGMPAETWSATIAELTTHRPIAAVDPRGSGHSDDITLQPGSQSNPSVDEASLGQVFADDMSHVLDELEWDSAHVAGISMGAMIAQQLALTRPERVRSLTLISTYARPGPWTDRVWELRLAVAALNNPEPLRLASALFLTGPAAVEHDPNIIRRLIGLWQSTPTTPASYVAQMRYCADHDLHHQLQNVRIPAVVISGEHDLLCTPAAGLELARLLGCDHIEIPTASHLLATEQPAQLAVLIEQHLDAVDRNVSAGEAGPTPRTEPLQ